MHYSLRSLLLVISGKPAIFPFYSPVLGCSPTLRLCSLAPGSRALLCAPERPPIGPNYRHICFLIGQSFAWSNPQVLLC